MTKRLNSKHKIDRRLKVTFGEDQKALSIKEHTLQDNTDNLKMQNYQTTELNFKLSKN